MIKEKNDFEKVEPVEDDNITLAEIIEDEDEKKILEPVKVDDENPYVVGKVVPNVAYVRKEPRAHSEVISFLQRGNTVIIYKDGDVNEYYKISGNFNAGYVLKSDITLN